MRVCVCEGGGMVVVVVAGEGLEVERGALTAQ